MNNKVEHISNLFGSKTRYKILKLYAENGGDKFFVREITRLIDEQINSVRRELENLESIGLLQSKLKNNKRYFFVNNKGNLYRGLCVMLGVKQSQKTAPAPNVRRSGTSFEIVNNKSLPRLRGLCEELIVKDGPNSPMPIDVFCIVSTPELKVDALEILSSADVDAPSGLAYSVLTKDEYDLGAKLNPDIYVTIHETGLKIV